MKKVFGICAFLVITIGFLSCEKSDSPLEIEALFEDLNSADDGSGAPERSHIMDHQIRN